MIGTKGQTQTQLTAMTLVIALLVVLGYFTVTNPGALFALTGFITGPLPDCPNPNSFCDNFADPTRVDSALSSNITIVTDPNLPTHITLQQGVTAGVVMSDFIDIPANNFWDKIKITRVPHNGTVVVDIMDSTGTTVLIPDVRNGQSVAELNNLGVTQVRLRATLTNPDVVFASPDRDFDYATIEFASASEYKEIEFQTTNLFNHTLTRELVVDEQDGNAADFSSFANYVTQSGVSDPANWRGTDRAGIHELGTVRTAPHFVISLSGINNAPATVRYLDFNGDGNASIKLSVVRTAGTTNYEIVCGSVVIVIGGAGGFVLNPAVRPFIVANCEADIIDAVGATPSTNPTLEVVFPLSNFTSRTIDVYNPESSNAITLVGPSFSIDTKAGDFNGTFVNTELTPTGELQLVSGQTTGTYESRVHDAIEPAIWNSLHWQVSGDHLLAAHFEDIGTEQVIDSSERVNDGVTTGSTNGVFGKAGGFGVLLDGIDDVVNFGDGRDWAMGTEPFSLEVWAKPNLPNDDAAGDILTSYSTTAAHEGVTLGFIGSASEGGQRLQFGVNDGYFINHVEVASKFDTVSINRMVVFNGSIYAGAASDGGRLLKWTKGDTAWTEAASAYLNDQLIGSMAVHNGRLFAGTSPSVGHLLEFVAGVGWVQRAGSLESQSQITSLVSFKGKLYGGTLPGGKLLEWDETGAQWVKRADTLPSFPGTEVITSMILYNGKLYASTGSSGQLLEFDEVNNQWLAKASQVGSSGLTSIIVFKGRIYGIARDNSLGLTSIVRWDGSSSWITEFTSLQPLNNLMVFNGDLYALPAVFTTSPLFIYTDGIQINPIGGQLPSAPTAVVAYDGMIYLATGSGGTLHSVGSGSVAMQDIPYTNTGMAHIVGVREATQLKLYVDGVLVDTSDSFLQGSLDLNQLTALGSTGQFVDYFDGILDEIKLHPRALSSAEVLERYSSGLQGFNDGLLDRNKVVTIGVRTCDDPQCSGEGYTQELTGSPGFMNLTENRYFQYKINFDSNNPSVSPKVHSVVARMGLPAAQVLEDVEQTFPFLLAAVDDEVLLDANASEYTAELNAYQSAFPQDNEAIFESWGNIEDGEFALFTGFSNYLNFFLEVNPGSRQTRGYDLNNDLVSDLAVTSRVVIGGTAAPTNFLVLNDRTPLTIDGLANEYTTQDNYTAEDILVFPWGTAKEYAAYDSVNNRMVIYLRGIEEETRFVSFFDPIENEPVEVLAITSDASQGQVIVDCQGTTIVDTDQAINSGTEPCLDVQVTAVVAPDNGVEVSINTTDLIAVTGRGFVVVNNIVISDESVSLVVPGETEYPAARFGFALPSLTSVAIDASDAEYVAELAPGSTSTLPAADITAGFWGDATDYAAYSSNMGEITVYLKALTGQAFRNFDLDADNVPDLKLGSFAGSSSEIDCVGEFVAFAPTAGAVSDTCRGVPIRYAIGSSSIEVAFKEVLLPVGQLLMTSQDSLFKVDLQTGLPVPSSASITCADNPSFANGELCAGHTINYITDGGAIEFKALGFSIGDAVRVSNPDSPKSINISLIGEQVVVTATQESVVLDGNGTENSTTIDQNVSDQENWPGNDTAVYDNTTEQLILFYELDGVLDFQLTDVEGELVIDGDETAGAEYDPGAASYVELTIPDDDIENWGASQSVDDRASYDSVSGKIGILLEAGTGDEIQRRIDLDGDGIEDLALFSNDTSGASAAYCKAGDASVSLITYDLASASITVDAVDTSEYTGAGINDTKTLLPFATDARLQDFAAFDPAGYIAVYADVTAFSNGPTETRRFDFDNDGTYDLHLTPRGSDLKVVFECPGSFSVTLGNMPLIGADAVCVTSGGASVPLHYRLSGGRGEFNLSTSALPGGTMTQTATNWNGQQIRLMSPGATQPLGAVELPSGINTCAGTTVDVAKTGAIIEVGLNSTFIKSGYVTVASEASAYAVRLLTPVATQNYLAHILNTIFAGAGDSSIDGEIDPETEYGPFPERDYVVSTLPFGEWPDWQGNDSASMAAYNALSNEIRLASITEGTVVYERRIDLDNDQEPDARWITNNIDTQNPVTTIQCLAPGELFTALTLAGVDISGSFECKGVTVTYATSAVTDVELGLKKSGATGYVVLTTPTSTRRIGLIPEGSFQPLALTTPEPPQTFEFAVSNTATSLLVDGVMNEPTEYPAYPDHDYLDGNLPLSDQGNWFSNEMLDFVVYDPAFSKIGLGYSIQDNAAPERLVDFNNDGTFDLYFSSYATTPLPADHILRSQISCLVPGSEFTDGGSFNLVTSVTNDVSGFFICGQVSVEYATEFGTDIELSLTAGPTTGFIVLGTNSSANKVKLIPAGATNSLALASETRDVSYPTLHFMSPDDKELEHYNVLMLQSTFTHFVANKDNLLKIDGNKTEYGGADEYVAGSIVSDPANWPGEDFVISDDAQDMVGIFVGSAGLSTLNSRLERRYDLNLDGTPDFTIVMIYRFGNIDAILRCGTYGDIVYWDGGMPISSIFSTMTMLYECNGFTIYDSHGPQGVEIGLVAGQLSTPITVSNPASANKIDLAYFANQPAPSAIFNFFTESSYGPINVDGVADFDEYVGGDYIKASVPPASLSSWDVASGTTDVASTDLNNDLIGIFSRVRNTVVERLIDFNEDAKPDLYYKLDGLCDGGICNGRVSATISCLVSGDDWSHTGTFGTTGNIQAFRGCGGVGIEYSSLLTGTSTSFKSFELVIKIDTWDSDSIFVGSNDTTQRIQLLKPIIQRTFKFGVKPSESPMELDGGFSSQEYGGEWQSDYLAIFDNDFERPQWGDTFEASAFDESTGKLAVYFEAGEGPSERFIDLDNDGISDMRLFTSVASTEFPGVINESEIQCLYPGQEFLDSNNGISQISGAFNCANVPIEYFSLSPIGESSAIEFTMDSTGNFGFVTVSAPTAVDVVSLVIPAAQDEEGYREIDADFDGFPELIIVYGSQRIYCTATGEFIFSDVSPDHGLGSAECGGLEVEFAVSDTGRSAELAIAKDSMTSNYVTVTNPDSTTSINVFLPEGVVPEPAPTTSQLIIPVNIETDYLPPALDFWELSWTLNDTDGDGIADPIDNCPDVFNPSQADSNGFQDGTGAGDACEEIPDVLVSAIQVLQNPVQRGNLANISITVSSIGNKAPGAFTVTITDQTESPAVIIDQRTVTFTNAIDSTAYTVQYDTTGKLDGSHTLRGFADSGNVVEELDEANNILTTTLTIEIPNTAPFFNGTIPTQNLIEDQVTPVTLLLSQFAFDAETASTDLFYTLVSNSNPTLVSAVFGVSCTANCKESVTGGLKIGIAQAEASGSSQLCVNVNDGFLTSAQQCFNVIVESVDDAPVISAIPLQTFVEDTVYTGLSLDNFVTDVDTAPSGLIWASTQPGNLTIVINSVPPHQVTVTPQANFFGTRIATFNVTDGTSFDEVDVTFNVTPVNDNPIIIGLPGSILLGEGENITLNLTQNVTDVEDLPQDVLWTVSNVDLVEAEFLDAGQVITPGSATDTTQGDFNQGTFSSTESTATGEVQLSTGQTTGTFTSRVIDAGSAAAWNTATWTALEPSSAGGGLTGGVLLAHMDDASGVITDSSGNSNNGVNNGATYSAPAQLGFGTAMSFDGIDDYIDFSDDPDFDFGTGTFTLEAWVNPDAAGDDNIGDIISKFDTAAKKGYHLTVLDNYGSSHSNKRNIEFGIDNNAPSTTLTKVADRFSASDTFMLALIDFNGSLYGTATNGAANSLFRWSGSAWVRAAGDYTGANELHSMAVHNNKLYAGTSGSDNLGHLLEWNGVDAWIPRVTTNLNAQQGIESMVSFNGRLFGATRPNARLFEWTGGSVWTQRAGTPAGVTTDQIESLAVYNGKLYGATVTTGKLLEWNETGSSWTERAPQITVGGAGQTINSIAVYNGKLYAAGRGVLLEWNGVNAWVNRTSQFPLETLLADLAVYNGRLYAAAVSNKKLLEWDEANSAWLDRGSPIGATVAIRPAKLTVHNGKLYVSTRQAALNDGAGALYEAKTGIEATNDVELSTGTWHHIVGVKDTSTLKLYIDGALVDTSDVFTASSFNLDNAVPLTVGKGTHDYYNGLMDEVIVYNRALTGTEVADRFTGGPASTSGGFDTNLTMQFRSCNDAVCSGESFGSEFSTSPQSIAVVPDNRYFQYRANLVTSDSAETPQLLDATIDFETSLPANSGTQLKITVPIGVSGGEDEITLTAIDTDGGNDTENMTIIIGVANSPPTIDPIPSQNATEDVVFNLNVGPFVSDPDNDDLTITSNSVYQISSAILCASPYSSCVLSFLYPEGVLADTFNVTVNDGEFVVFRTVNVTVTPVNDGPVIDPALPDVSFPEDSFDDTLVLDNFVTDADNTKAELIWTFSGNTNIFVSIGSAAQQHKVNFTAAQDFNGQETITFVVRDPENLNDTDTIIVTVTVSNDAPQAQVIPPITFAEDTVFTGLDLDGFVTDIDTPLSALVWTAAPVANLSVFINASTHGVTITPDADFNGIRTIVFTVNDSEFTDSTSVLVNVTPVNDAPTLAAIPDIDVNESSNTTTNFRSVDLAPFANDVDNDALTFSAVGSTNVNVNITGTILTVWGDPLFIGTETIQVAVTDTSNEQASRNVNVNVLDVNTPPTITSVTITPADPRTTDTLTCVATATDLDVGDTISFAYEWEQTLANGTQIIRSESTPTINSAETKKNEIWQCTATPFDSFPSQGTSATAVTTILNSAPVAVAESDAVTVQVGDSLGFSSANSPDADLDTLFYTWNFGDSTSFGPTTSTGVAHTYTSTGSKTVVLNVSDLEASDTDSLTINVVKEGTTMTANDANCVFSDSCLLSATLQEDDGPAVVGETITLTAGTQSCNAVTDGAGFASCSFNVSQAPGSATITASFAGTANYTSSSDTATLTIAKETLFLSLDTVLARFSDPTPAVSGSAEENDGPTPTQAAQARVFVDADGDTLQGVGETCDANIVSGLFTCQPAASIQLAQGTYSITVNLLSNTFYTAAQATGTLNVDPEQTIITADSKTCTETQTCALSGNIQSDDAEFRSVSVSQGVDTNYNSIFEALETCSTTSSASTGDFACTPAAPLAGRVPGTVSNAIFANFSGDAFWQQAMAFADLTVADDDTQGPTLSVPAVVNESASNLNILVSVSFTDEFTGNSDISEAKLYFAFNNPGVSDTVNDGELDIISGTATLLSSFIGDAKEGDTIYWIVKVTDNDNDHTGDKASTFSSVVSTLITDDDTTAPEVTLTSPVNNQVLGPDDIPFTVTAVATDTGSGINKVEFFQFNGVPVSIGIDTVPGPGNVYSVSWNPSFTLGANEFMLREYGGNGRGLTTGYVSSDDYTVLDPTNYQGTNFATRQASPNYNYVNFFEPGSISDQVRLIDLNGDNQDDLRITIDFVTQDFAIECKNLSGGSYELVAGFQNGTWPTRTDSSCNTVGLSGVKGATGNGMELFVNRAKVLLLFGNDFIGIKSQAATTYIKLKSIIVPPTGGVFNLRAVATDNDNSPSTAQDEVFNITVDLQPPVIQSIDADDTQIYTSTTITANVTDNFAVGTATATVFAPNGALAGVIPLTPTFTAGSTQATFVGTFSNTSQLGAYLVSVTTVDQTGQSATDTATFQAQDTLLPVIQGVDFPGDDPTAILSILNLNPLNKTVNIYEPLDEAAFVSDNYQLTSVYGEFITPSVTAFTQQCEDNVGPVAFQAAELNFTCPFTQTAELGTYTARVFATDDEVPVEGFDLRIGSVTTFTGTQGALTLAQDDYTIIDPASYTGINLAGTIGLPSKNYVIYFQPNTVTDAVRLVDINTDGSDDFRLTVDPATNNFAFECRPFSGGAYSLIANFKNSTYPNATNSNCNGIGFTGIKAASGSGVQIFFNRNKIFSLFDKDYIGIKSLAATEFITLKQIPLTFKLEAGKTVSAYNGGDSPFNSSYDYSVLNPAFYATSRDFAARATVTNPNYLLFFEPSSTSDTQRIVDLNGDGEDDFRVTVDPATNNFAFECRPFSGGAYSLVANFKNSTFPNVTNSNCNGIGFTGVKAANTTSTPAGVQFFFSKAHIFTLFGNEFINIKNPASPRYIKLTQEASFQGSVPTYVSVSETFTVADQTAPTIVGILLAENYTVNDTITLLAGVSDNYQLTQVETTVLHPNGTLFTGLCQQSVAPVAFSSVNLAYECNITDEIGSTADTGTYQITITATDGTFTTDAIVETEVTVFGEDTTAPEILAAQAESPVEVYNTSRINATAFDNIALNNTGLAFITNSNGTIVEIVTLAEFASRTVPGGEEADFEGDFTETLFPDLYNAELIILDAAGNEARVNVTVLVRDSIAPVVTVTPVPGTVEVFTASSIQLDVTDNYDIDAITASYVAPSGGAPVQLCSFTDNTMPDVNLRTQDTFSAACALNTTELGIYAITVTANDSEGNTIIEGATVTAQDTIAPEIVDLALQAETSTLLNGTFTVVFGSQLNLTGAFTDNFDIDTAVVTTTTSLGTTQQIVNYPASPEFSFSGLLTLLDTATLGPHTVTVEVFDSSGNSADSVSEGFAIEYTVAFEVQLEIVSITVAPTVAPLHPPLTDNSTYAAGESFNIIVQVRNTGAFNTSTATLSTDTVSVLLSFANTSVPLPTIAPGATVTGTLSATVPVTASVDDFENVIINLIANAAEIEPPVEPAENTTTVTIVGTNGLVAEKLALVALANSINLNNVKPLEHSDFKVMGNKIEQVEKAGLKMEKEFLESQVQLPMGSIDSLRAAGHQTEKDCQSAILAIHKAEEREARAIKKGKTQLAGYLQQLQDIMRQVKRIDMIIMSTLIDQDVSNSKKACHVEDDDDTAFEDPSNNVRFLKDFHEIIRQLKKQAKIDAPFCSVDADCDDGLSYNVDVCKSNGFCKYKKAPPAGGDDDDDDDDDD